MDIAWWSLSKIAEPIYIYVVPINYGSNVFYHDHTMTQIKVVKYFENLWWAPNCGRIFNKTAQPMSLYLVSIN